MLRSLITSCLISAYFPTGSLAQDTSQSGSRPTVTIQSTITVVPVAFTTSVEEYLPAPSSPTCDAGRVECPACDGEHVDVDGGYTYRIHCDAGLSSNTSVLQPAYITPNQCLVVCDSASDCVGTTLAANGSCVLAIGRSDFRLGSSIGDIAFEQIRYSPVNSTGSSNSSASSPLASKFFSSATIPLVYPTSYPDASSTPTVHLPKPYYANFTLPNSTYPVNSSVPTNNTCSSSNPTCPACDNQTVTDRHNVTYTVLCGYSLDATLDYAFGEPLPAAYCMSRCDERNVTCLGASWSTEECVLALGPYVKVEDPDHIAFVRAAIPPAPYPIMSTGSLPRPPISTGLSYLNMSRYDGVSYPQPTVVGTDVITPSAVTATNPPFPILTSLDPYCSYVSGIAVACYGSAVAATAYAPAPTPNSEFTTLYGFQPFTSLPPGAASHPDPYCYYVTATTQGGFSAVVCQRRGTESIEFETATAIVPEDASTPAPAPASDFTTTARGVPFTTLPPGASPYPDDPYCFYITTGGSTQLVCQRGGGADSPVEPTATASESEDISTPTPEPSQGFPEPYGGFRGPWGGSPPWAHDGGDYGVDEGSRHHKPQGSWWQGGRPQWSHWGWGKQGSRHGQKNRGEK